jgi:hypothetical protein
MGQSSKKWFNKWYSIIINPFNHEKSFIFDPTAPRNSGDPIMVTFNVVLGRDDNNSMTWAPEDSEEGTPTLFWTRGTY